MKFLDEYRDAEKIKILINQIRSLQLPPINIMEVCGSQTHTILKYSLEELLPENINLIHGPGCPVCVTPVEMIDKANVLAGMDDVIFTSYGDMLRIPGSRSSLIETKALGADIKMIYSPLDAIRIAKEEPNKKVIFFAIGFETTAPANASAILIAQKLSLKNFFVLCSHVLIPPAIEALLNSELIKLNGLLAPGHVCTITGTKWCENISGKHKIPIAVTGFEPVDLLEGILITAKQIVSNEHHTVNQYKRVVQIEGNKTALKTIDKVFEVCDRNWRGLGEIKNSGLKLRDEFEKYDAEKVFNISSVQSFENEKCIAGEILQGLKKPLECKLFSNECTPIKPVGAPMVSSEGACAAYYNYRK
ncbi:MAG: hydrogenase formation protein HypD [Ignavibacteriaceae bacterium]|nr:hydrogenase formation protein HypD [Ignavibacteriaceae bacterium]